MDEDKVSNYYQNLQSFLFDEILSSIVEDKTKRKLYIQPEMMKIWIQAFTHESFGEDYDYQQLETLGDKMSGSIFTYYMIQRDPDLTSSELTNLEHKILSNHNLTNLSMKLKLTNYIQISNCVKSYSKIEADLFESFVGALFTISEKIMMGLGFINCFNFFIDIFDDIEIEETDKLGDPITIVSQILEIIGFAGKQKHGNIFEKDEILSNGKIKFTLNVSDDVTDLFLQNGKKIKRILGEGMDGTSKGAKYLCYSNALSYFLKNGIDLIWAKKVKKQKLFQTQKMRDLLPKLNKRLKQEGFVDFEFDTPDKINTKGVAMISLIGIKQNGKQRTLELYRKDPNKDMNYYILFNYANYIDSEDC
jgi:dsRNA-specific ribonuclease